jgi:Holliday junction resolvasome RuvABC ATP-dependent DNA helicase subunit
VHLVDELAETRPNDFVLLEDIHRLSAPVLALLAEAIAQGQVPSSDGQRLDRSRPFPLPDLLTIIGTTNVPGKLASSLSSRFLTLSIAPYSNVELKAIVVSIARQQGRDVTPQAARALAAAAEGSPRQASVLLETIALAAGQPRITEAVVREGLERAGMDTLGFWPRHRSYLRALLDAGDVGLGLEALSIKTGLDAAYIRRDIEPTLLARSFIEIRGASRWLSEMGQVQALAVAAHEGASHGSPIHDERDHDTDEPSREFAPGAVSIPAGI